MGFQSIWFVIVLLVGLLHVTSGQLYGSYRYRQYGPSAAPRKRNSTSNSGSSPSSSDVCTPSASTKLTFPTFNEGCFPNILENGVPVDPFQRIGTFYEFRSRLEEVQVYNTRIINSLVCDGSIYLPGTYIPAVHFTQLYRYITLSSMNANSRYPPTPGYQYNYGSKVNCTYDWLDILSGYNGVDHSNTFSFYKGTFPPQSADVFYYLFSKPGERGFEIQYDCVELNQQTGICNKVQVFVFTRVNPSQMTRDENDEIEDTIDRVLAPYCMTKDDLQKIIHGPDLDIEQCDMPPPPAFTNLVNGYASSLPKRKPSDRRFYTA